MVSGGCVMNSKRIVIGGWAWACWGCTNVQRLSLNVMTLNPVCNHVETKEGVALSVTGVAQVMVMANDHMADHEEIVGENKDVFLAKALEQFLGKSESEIRDTILQTLEGHLRAILGTLTVEEIYKDRETFAKLVKETASPDVAKMGLEILSFTIKDLTDNVNYLSSLGKAQTAIVVRDADIGKAEAARDSGIASSQCEQKRLDTRYEADSAIANSVRGYETRKAGFDMEVNQMRAEAELAYSLEEAKLKQQIRSEEIEIEVVERRRQIEVEEQEVLRKEKELVATVNRPAEAERYKMETIAEALKTQAVYKATGEAESIKLIGSAEASSIAAIGEAEAQAMKARAAAYKNYGEAAIMNLVLESLPKIAAEIAAPLAQTKEILLMSGNGGGSSADNITAEVTKLLGTLPPAVQALTGIDIGKALKLAAGGAQ